MFIDRSAYQSVASLWETSAELPLLSCCCLLQLLPLLVKAWHYLATAVIMLILSFRTRFSIALYSRPIRLSEDGYVAAACHGLLFTNASVRAYVRLVVAHRHKVRQAPQGLENMKFAIESTSCENDIFATSISDCTVLVVRLRECNAHKTKRRLH